MASSTSSNLKAARLFRPWTRASRAKKSFPCRDFHLVDDEDCRIESALARLHDTHLGVEQRKAMEVNLASSSKLSVSCWKTRRDSMESLTSSDDAVSKLSDMDPCGSALSIACTPTVRLLLIRDSSSPPTSYGGTRTDRRGLLGFQNRMSLSRLSNLCLSSLSAIPLD